MTLLIRKPQLAVNAWLAEQHLDNGIPLAELRVEWKYRHLRETRHKVMCPSDSMVKAIQREQIRRQAMTKYTTAKGNDFDAARALVDEVRELIHKAEDELDAAYVRIAEMEEQRRRMIDDYIPRSMQRDEQNAQRISDLEEQIEALGAWRPVKDGTPECETLNGWTWDELDACVPYTSEYEYTIVARRKQQAKEIANGTN